MPAGPLNTLPADRRALERGHYMTESTRIVIIGGGASAVCLLDALSRRGTVPDAVTVFEPSAHLWRGRAYQPDSAALRVNAPPDDMSVNERDLYHFEKWLHSRGERLGAHPDYTDSRTGVPYVSRAVYGDYLEQAARTALALLADRGCRIELVRETVVSLEDMPPVQRLRTSGGREFEADHTVLCVGGGRPADPYRLRGTPHFLPDPYPAVCRLADIAPDAEVAVIGSGLTAVDVVLTLSRWGHRGRISLLSRRGILPTVRQRPVEFALDRFTPEHFRAMAARGETLTLAEAAEVMRGELEAAGADYTGIVHEVTCAENEDPLARLKRHLSTVDDPGLGMRILQRAVPDTGPDVWPLLPEADKNTLLKEHYRTIMSLCCPMPPSSAAVLLDLAAEGQLELLRGLESLRATPDGRFHAVTAAGERTPDVVINAVSPPTHRISPHAEPLIDSLVNASLARRHPRGGLHVERATSRLIAQGVPQERLYALGDLASGSLFFTFGVPSLVDRACDIADTLMGTALYQPPVPGTATMQHA